MLKVTVNETFALTFGFTLSLSKDEAAARPLDGLRMRRVRTTAPAEPLKKGVALRSQGSVR